MGDMSDFMDALRSVALNDSYAKWIAGNALNAGALLSLRGGHDFDKEYWAHVLTHYRDSFRFDTSTVDLQKFTLQRGCDSFRRFRRDNPGLEKDCLGYAYVCRGALQDAIGDYSEVPPLEVLTEALPGCRWTNLAEPKFRCTDDSRGLARVGVKDSTTRKQCSAACHKHKS